MHLNNILVGSLIALSGTALAMPLSAGKLRLARFPVTGLSGSRTWPKITSPNASNSTSHGPESTDARPADMCKDLCGLQSQACILALPQDEQFCYDTYTGCSDRCQ